MFTVNRKTDNLKGAERDKELMSDNRFKASEITDSSGRTGRYLGEEIVKSNQDGRLVYCRFGKQYVANLEKQLNSIVSNTA